MPRKRSTRSARRPSNQIAKPLVRRMQKLVEARKMTAASELLGELTIRLAGLSGSNQNFAKWADWSARLLDRDSAHLELVS